jgi:hypothetical protein
MISKTLIVTDGAIISDTGIPQEYVICNIVNGKVSSHPISCNKS